MNTFGDGLTVFVYMWGDNSYVMDYTWIIWHVLVMCIWHAEAASGEKIRVKRWETRGRWSFLIPLSLDNMERETSWGRGGGERRWEGREDCENKEETIKEKCKHCRQNADKRLKTKTLYLPVLNSPLFLSVDTSLESSDCDRLLSNQNPVETVSERPIENTMHDKSGPPNCCNQDVYVW